MSILYLNERRCLQVFFYDSASNFINAARRHSSGVKGAEGEGGAIWKLRPMAVCVPIESRVDDANQADDAAELTRKFDKVRLHSLML